MRSDRFALNAALAAGVALAIAAVFAIAPPVAGQTPAEAYKRGCASCHASEGRVLRAIPKGDDARRRAWLEAFMAQHPCERDDLKALIVQYLVERSRPAGTDSTLPPTAPEGTMADHAALFPPCP